MERRSWTVAVLAVGGAAAVVVAVVAAGFVRGTHRDDAATTRPGDANAVVERVVDGDTVDLDIGGTRERVRLIGINTPESVDPDRPVECFGHEAADYTRALLAEGTPVYVERDAEPRDDYGRLLAYVRRASDGLFVNLDLVVQGYAVPLRIEPNTTYASDFAAAAAAAERGDVACGAHATGRFVRVSTLAEQLGYPADARLVILSCDDLGSCHAANVGVYDALRRGAATCSSIMVPAPWAREAAARYDGEDIGVHLTLNAEHELYRWGPITHAPSLMSGEGGFPRTIDDLWEHADYEEVLRECRAQIERALAWGIDVTHLAPHLSAITLRPEFFDVYLELAVEFRLPIRLPSTLSEEQAGFPFRRLAADEGLVFPDHFDHDWRPGSRDRVFAAIEALAPGVTEIHVQPVIDTAEVRAVSADAPAWIDDYRLVVHEASRVRGALEQAGATLIGYRALRDVMRDETRNAITAR